MGLGGGDLLGNTCAQVDLLCFAAALGKGVVKAACDSGDLLLQNLHRLAIRSG
jgi:hypothetical protein